MKNTISEARQHPKITVHAGVEVKSTEGFVGNFQVTLAEKGQEGKVPCGAIIVATGAVPADTRDFRRGQSPNIITQVELEKED